MPQNAPSRAASRRAAATLSSVVVVMTPVRSETSRLRGTKPSPAALMGQIEREGGMLRAIDSGWVHTQIAEAAWAYQQRVAAGTEVVVGVNRFVEEAPPLSFALHRHAEGFEAEQTAALKSLRETRDSARVRRALEELRSAAASTTNLLPVLVETVKTYATIGEMCGVLRELFGEYRAPQVY